LIVFAVTAAFSVLRVRLAGPPYSTKDRWGSSSEETLKIREYCFSASLSPRP
jgi:hypothetical protein